MSLDNKTRKQFKAIGHHLHPVLIIVGELTENINTELERALNQHELIKVQVKVADREVKKAMVSEICKAHKAELIQMTGHVALIYRPTKDPKPNLSNILRFKNL